LCQAGMINKIAGSFLVTQRDLGNKHCCWNFSWNLLSNVSKTIQILCSL